MNTVDVLVRSYAFNRQRTLGLLDQIEQSACARDVLGWRPGAARAHIGWQLMHIGITEEIFATERLAPDKPGELTEFWPRFRGGSTPDDQILEPSDIRHVLARSRERLLDTLARFEDEHLGIIPEALKVRNLTILDALHIISWHEAHHHGQAHVTLNLYNARSLTT